jgi:MFS family permease
LALLRWFKEPQVGSEVNRKNFLFVQIDAIGIGLANAAAPFLPVFLTRLGATNFQVGLLTSMPALTGLMLALVIGGYLQRKSNIVPWFGTARLLVVLSYALTGIAPFIVPRQYLVFVILAIWALATLPQTIVSILFSVVMNTVAGPTGRFELMSRRWSIMGFTSAVTVVIVGQVLDRLGFPFNYQLVFMVLSIGGLISFYFSSHLDLPVRVIPVITLQGSKSQRLKEYWKLIFSQKPFINFALRRFVYLTGVSLAAPLFPLYFVRQLHASDAWIGLINTSSTAVMIVGYFFWVRRSRKHGTRMVLLWTTLGLSLYPFLVAITGRVEVVVLLAGMAGIFQAGLDLIFFDELMRNIPDEYCATFVSFAQSMQYLSAVVSPIIGTFLADTIGISGGLIVAAAIRLLGFGLFLTQKKESVVPTTPGAA